MTKYTHFYIYSRPGVKYTEVMVSESNICTEESWENKFRLLRKTWVYKRLTDMLPADTIHPLTAGRDVYDLLDYIDYMSSSSGDIYED